MRVTNPLLIVCRHLINEDGPHYGYRISKATGVKSGVLYPMLYRLQSWGWVNAITEYPREGSVRRVYQVTDKGREAITEIIDRR